MKNRKWIAGAAIAMAIGGGVGATVALLPNNSPANAATILKSDGYTAVPNSMMGQSNVDTIKPYVTSIAVGLSGNGIEAVAVFKPGFANMIKANAAEAMADNKGMTYSINGDVLKLDMPMSAINSGS